MKPSRIACPAFASGPDNGNSKAICVGVDTPLSISVIARRRPARRGMIAMAAPPVADCNAFCVEIETALQRVGQLPPCGGVCVLRLRGQRADPIRRRPIDVGPGALDDDGELRVIAHRASRMNSPSDWLRRLRIVARLRRDPPTSARSTLRCVRIGGNCERERLPGSGIVARVDRRAVRAGCSRRTDLQRRDVPDRSRLSAAVRGRAIARRAKRLGGIQTHTRGLIGCRSLGLSKQAVPSVSRPNWWRSVSDSIRWLSDLARRGRQNDQERRRLSNRILGIVMSELTPERRSLERYLSSLRRLETSTTSHCEQSMSSNR